jgi:hypothetical protein
MKDFHTYYSRLEKLFNKVDKEVRGFGTEDSVDALRDTICNLQGLFEDIQVASSDCEYAYKELECEHAKLDEKLESIMYSANDCIQKNFDNTVTFHIYKYQELELSLSKDQTFEGTLGLRLFDTCINNNSYSKHYMFLIVDEKKWNYTRIKFEI